MEVSLVCHVRRMVHMVYNTVAGVTAKSIVYISSSFLHEMGKRKVVVGFPFSQRIKPILQQKLLEQWLQCDESISASGGQ